MVLNCASTTQWSTTLGLLCLRLGLWAVFVVFNNCGHLISLASLQFPCTKRQQEPIFDECLFLGVSAELFQLSGFAMRCFQLNFFS